MNTAEQHLIRINEKLQLLLKEHQALKKDNARLHKELSVLEKENRSQKENMESLKEQVSLLKVSAGEMNDADKKDLEKRINNYIKEIDRCIALLSQ